MEKAKKLLMFGMLGVFLAFMGSTLAVVGGFHMFINFLQVYGAGLLTMIAGVVLFVAFILGIVALITNARVAVVAAILSIISSTTIACCLGIPMMSEQWIYDIPVCAVIISFAAFVMFMLYYVNNTAQKAVVTATTIELRVIYEAESTAQAKATVKKNAILCLVIPIAVMAILVTVITPSVRFGVYKWAYDALLHEMADMHEEHCVHSVSYHTFDRYLPDSYKDVAKIRAEEREYHIIDSMNAIQGYIRNSDDEQVIDSRARVAYMRLMELQAVDPRWNFNNFLSLPLQYPLFNNAMWQGDGIYLYVACDRENETISIDTNLPMVPIEDGAEMAYEFSEASFVCDEITLKFCDEIVLGFFDTHHTQYYCFKISALRYSHDTKEFSIDVYCYATATTYTLTYTETASWSDYE
ncbi:MAG: hypothetical protein K2J16_00490 [Clostridia bacterium]|nr:hypothetical protein [Clostridia bacterium]